MYRIIKIALIAVGVLAAVLWTQLPSKDAPLTEAVNNGALSTMFLVTFILILAAAVLAVLFGLLKTISTPGGLKRAVISIVALAVIAIIGYALAGEEEAVIQAVKLEQKSDVSAGTVKNIGMLLNVFFAMLLIAIGSMTLLPAVLKVTRR